MRNDSLKYVHPCRASQDDLVWVETLSWEPRAFAYHNFLSKEVQWVSANHAEA